jgi:hypothetical protein
MNNLIDLRYALRNCNSLEINTSALDSTNVNAGFMDDLWMYNLSTTVSAPTTATACSRSTAGALNVDIANSAGSNKLYFIGSTLENYNTIWYRSFLLVDRLSHQGGLSYTLTTTQTTNLPTAALTRYTDGSGVMIGITTYGALNAGFTGGTVTMSYTNQSGTSGRTAVATTMPAGNARAIGTFGIISLQSGDTGVRSVESVTSSITATSGTFGVCLFKPLGIVSFTDTCIYFNNFIDGGFMGGIPEIIDDACLSLIGFTDKQSNAGKGVSRAQCVLHFYESPFDVTPNAVNWDDISWFTASLYGTISSKQITGIKNSIQLNLTEPVTTPDDVTLWYRVTDTEITGTQTDAPPTSPWIQIASGSGTTFTVKNNQWVSFTCYGANKLSPASVNVVNVSDGNAVIDSFNIEAVD